MKEVKEKYGKITGKVLHETKRAILFNDYDKEGWIPVSVIEDVTENSEGDTVMLVEKWFLEKAEWSFEDGGD